jgi:demethylmenaquinone methyltransferase/2-methoxy-6-polyprenyl-1,4-benzoquinol methylase
VEVSVTKLDRRDAVEPHPVLARFYQERGQRSLFVRRLFNDTAPFYDGINRLFSLGTGSRYRRRCLIQAGLRPGLRVIDVAVGTGLLAREAVAITSRRHDVIGVDLSEAMLGIAQRNLGIPLVQGTAEDLPLADHCADFVSMGFALRHVSDLLGTFREFHRVLRPGGTLLVLEIGAPRKAFNRKLLATYLGRVIPLVYGWRAEKVRTQMLMDYYWETIENCVPAETIQETMAGVGFDRVECRAELDLFRSYIGRKREGVRGN